MKTRTKALVTALVVVAIVWSVIIAAWFRKADWAGSPSETNDAFLGVLALGCTIVAGIVIFASVMSGKKPPPPAWADPDKRLPEARVHRQDSRTPPRRDGAR